MITNKQQTTEDWRIAKRKEAEDMFEKNKPKCSFCKGCVVNELCILCKKRAPGFNSWMAH
jgi:hypothetical protein